MRYDDIPNLNNWKADAFVIHKLPLDPIVRDIDDMLVKYQQAFSPMAKRNLLADLERSCLAWKPPKPKNVAMDALLEVVRRKLAYSGSVAHTYDNAVCISYSVTTGAFEGNTNIVKYQGQLDDEQDMRERVQQMKAAVNQAYNFVPPASRNDDKTLKIFMAPEFFFRGRYGAYPPELVSQILPLLRSGDNGTGKPLFKDWLFIFGTAISAAIDARQYCFTCHSGQHIVFQRDPTNPSRTIAKCSKGAAHDVREGIYGAIIDNVALIQKGSEDHLVAKEFISGIDFRDIKDGKGPFVSMNNAGVRQDMPPLSTEGARGSGITSKFTDERMGGGVFNIDGITFGMEICLDHAEHKLSAAGNLQILLIPSAGMEIEPGHTIIDGISFNVDGLRAEGDVLLRSGAGVRPSKTRHSLNGIKGDIEVFQSVPIPYV
ncbi:hypothetical protein [Methylomarinum vadi]|uniref:hypothetical protein n=1 Tax=Methylomarinum vadi TaxID=438855 RepID=UPI0004DFA9FD|nr:hypothetical protein [Methylomarinum vadi]